MEEKSVNETMEAPLQVEQTELEKLSEDNLLLNDKYLRLYSDFENFKRRTIKERQDLIESGNEKIIKDLISVVDNFERCNDMSDGVKLIYNQTLALLTKYNVSKFEVKGMVFNPDTMEAITSIPGGETNIVADVIECGYQINNKIIRIPKVVVFN